MTQIKLTGDSPVDELIQRYLPDMIELFRSKARDYESEGTFAADMLGSRGQFAELWRKIGKLKRCMWDGKPMAHEQPAEILADLFGHIMLATDYVTRNDAEIVTRKRTK